MKRRFRGAPKEYERYWQQILREGLKSGEFRADLDIEVVSYGLLGMVNWLDRWYEPRGRVGVREIAGQFSAMALAGLVAAERSGGGLITGAVRKRKATWPP